MQLCPPPDDFRQTAPLHTLPELRGIYGCGSVKIRRWALETGAAYRGIRLHYRKRRTADEIDICLHCERTDCRGFCADVPE